jgi:hypothetical protein
LAIQQKGVHDPQLENMTLILSQWRAEWLKLLGRKRTYIGFGAFILLEAVILMVFQFEAPEKLYRRLIVQQGGAFVLFRFDLGFHRASHLSWALGIDLPRPRVG